MTKRISILMGNTESLFLESDLGEIKSLPHDWCEIHLRNKSPYEQPSTITVLNYQNIKAQLASPDGFACPNLPAAVSSAGIAGASLGDSLISSVLTSPEIFSPEAPPIEVSSPDSLTEEHIDTLIAMSEIPATILQVVTEVAKQTGCEDTDKATVTIGELKTLINELSSAEDYIPASSLTTITKSRLASLEATHDGTYTTIEALYEIIKAHKNKIKTPIIQELLDDIVESTNEAESLTVCRPRQMLDELNIHTLKALKDSITLPNGQGLPSGPLTSLMHNINSAIDIRERNQK